MIFGYVETSVIALDVLVKWCGGKVFKTIWSSSVKLESLTHPRNLRSSKKSKKTIIRWESWGQKSDHRWSWWVNISFFSIPTSPRTNYQASIVDQWKLFWSIVQIPSKYETWQRQSLIRSYRFGCDLSVNRLTWPSRSKRCRLSIWMNTTSTRFLHMKRKADGLQGPMSQKMTFSSIVQRWRIL